MWSEPVAFYHRGTFIKEKVRVFFFLIQVKWMNCLFKNLLCSFFLKEPFHASIKGLASGEYGLAYSMPYVWEVFHRHRLMSLNILGCGYRAMSDIDDLIGFRQGLPHVCRNSVGPWSPNRKFAKRQTPPSPISSPSHLQQWTSITAPS